jgi:branched-chain amino acid transport system ATP-binding protein
MALLEVKNLDVHYGVIQAIKDVSFEVNEGEIVTLIGADGAGKTTTMQSIMGLIHPSHGEIYYDGQKINGIPSHKIVKLGMTQVPEGRRIFSELTVYENLLMGAYTRTDKDGIEKDFKDIYTLFPRLEERRNQIAGTLSGGEQQMLAMGRALMAKPSILVLDEPSMGLAPILVEQIFDIIKELHEAGTTILLVEQNAQMALSIADRAYVLGTGLITMSGPAAEVLADDRVRAAYLGG